MPRSLYSGAMHHDDETVGRVWSRREMLVAFGTLPLAASGLARSMEPEITPLVDLMATPEVTEGPYFNDPAPRRSALMEGAARTTADAGTPLEIRLRVMTVRNGKVAPLAGARVDVWQCDSAGLYSGEAQNATQPVDTTGEEWGRGWLLTDSEGYVTFLSRYPGYYRTRTVHIHAKVRAYDAKGDKSREFTTQLFFDDSLTDKVLAAAPYVQYGPRPFRNDNDRLFNRRQADGTKVGDQLLLRTSTRKAGGYTAEFAVALLDG